MPSQFEFRFGPEEGSSPLVTYRGRSVRFRGVIDRIDHHRQHDGVCVVDYKSGRALTPKRNPQALQLVLYLLAACRGDAARLQRSEARFLYVTRRGGFVMQRLAGTRLAMRRHDFDALVQGVSAGIEAGELFPQPGPHALHCHVCDYRGLCDARIARQVQLKSGGEQDARWRQLPDFGADLEPLDSVAPGDSHD
jgi:RecB family exonuclease